MLKLGHNKLIHNKAMQESVVQEAEHYHRWFGIDPETAQKIVQVQQKDARDRSDADWQVLEAYRTTMSKVLMTDWH